MLNRDKKQIEKEVFHMLEHIDEYMSPESVNTNLLNLPGWSYIYKVLFVPISAMIMRVFVVTLINNDLDSYHDSLSWLFLSIVEFCIV